MFTARSVRSPSGDVSSHLVHVPKPRKVATIARHPDLADPDTCDAVRGRPYGYRLRCLEPDGHHGDHRWTPELVAEVSTVVR